MRLRAATARHIATPCRRLRRLRQGAKGMSPWSVGSAARGRKAGGGGGGDGGGPRGGREHRCSSVRADRRHWTRASSSVDRRHARAVSAGHDDTPVAQSMTRADGPPRQGGGTGLADGPPTHPRSQRGGHQRGSPRGSSRGSAARGRKAGHERGSSRHPRSCACVCASRGCAAGREPGPSFGPHQVGPAACARTLCSPRPPPPSLEPGHEPGEPAGRERTGLRAVSAFQAEEEAICRRDARKAGICRWPSPTRVSLVRARARLALLPHRALSPAPGPKVEIPAHASCTQTLHYLRSAASRCAVAASPAPVERRATREARLAARRASLA